MEYARGSGSRSGGGNRTWLTSVATCSHVCPAAVVRRRCMWLLWRAEKLRQDTGQDLSVKACSCLCAGVCVWCRCACVVFSPTHLPKNIQVADRCLSHCLYFPMLFCLPVCMSFSSFLSLSLSLSLAYVLFLFQRTPPTKKNQFVGCSLPVSLSHCLILSISVFSRPTSRRNSQLLTGRPSLMKYALPAAFPPPGLSRDHSA